MSTMNEESKVWIIGGECVSVYQSQRREFQFPERKFGKGIPTIPREIVETT